MSNKIDRKAVYAKYNGHCSYCGKIIEYKDMQVDHIIPQRAFDTTKPYRRKYKNLKDEIEVMDVNDFNNLAPVCRRCNHYKRANTLETFRRYLLDMKHKVLDDTYLGKVAMDYGMVEWKGWDGLFYFEKVEENNNR